MKRKEPPGWVIDVSEWFMCIFIAYIILSLFLWTVGRDYPTSGYHDWTFWQYLTNYQWLGIADWFGDLV